MGILKEPVAFMKALKLPSGFSVCELGDQKLKIMSPPSPAEAFYRQIGCGRYVSIDGNGHGTVKADLNLPLTGLKLGTFDLVTDFGTGEHIFDQAQVWRTLHDLTRPGGFIVFDRPSQGYEEHGFYLTHECVYLDLAAANGYTVIAFAKGLRHAGVLIRGVFRRPVPALAFCIPQQGRYRASLRLGRDQ